MATDYVEGPEHYITIDKAEAVEMIAYLAAQLADKPAPNSMSGAAPRINIVAYGQIQQRLHFIVDTKK